MPPPQEFVLQCEKKQLSLKIVVPFFLTSTEECVSWRNTNPAGVLKFLKYSNNLFSETLIPLNYLMKNLIYH